MDRKSVSSLLNRLLDPVGRSLTREAAQELVELRLDKQDRDYLERMARKSTAGELSDDERRQYQSYVTALTVVSILQSKARRLLTKQRGVARVS